MAGEKQQQRKAATTKSDVSSPRRGDKAKQSRQNSGDKEVLTHELQHPPNQTRYATRSGTGTAVTPTDTLQPKILDQTFQHLDENDTEEEAEEQDEESNSDLKSLDDETKQALALVGRVETEVLVDTDDSSEEQVLHMNQKRNPTTHGLRGVPRTDYAKNGISLF
jgi:hypothetical protein